MSHAVRHQIVVPVQYNAEEGEERRSVPEPILSDIRTDVIEVTGGATFSRVTGHQGTLEDLPAESYNLGVWIDSGRQYMDHLMTATADGDGGYIEVIQRCLLQEVARRIADELRQQSVYYTCHPIWRTYVKGRTGGTEPSGVKVDMKQTWFLVINPIGDYEGPGSRVEGKAIGLVAQSAWGGVGPHLRGGDLVAGLTDRFARRHFDDIRGTIRGVALDAASEEPEEGSTVDASEEDG